MEEHECGTCKYYEQDNWFHEYVCLCEQSKHYDTVRKESDKCEKWEKA